SKSAYTRCLSEGRFLRLAGAGHVEAVEVHDFRPCGDEVFHEFPLRSGDGVDFSERAQLRVRTEDQVDARSGPFCRVCLAVAALVHALLTVSRLPLRAHIQQIDEEVIRQYARSLREDTVL